MVAVDLESPVILSCQPTIGPSIWTVSLTLDHITISCAVGPIRARLYSRESGCSGPPSVIASGTRGPHGSWRFGFGGIQAISIYRAAPRGGRVGEGITNSEAFKTISIAPHGLMSKS